jgi:threonine/homoserine/homoserine lactone efflux protein
MFEFMTITLIILLSTISPGPDFAIVSRNALRYTQKTGVMTALGVACGTLFHSIYCILGFAIIISRSLLLFNIIKYIGAAYLIYLGVLGLFEKRESFAVDGLEPVKNLSDFQAFRQ